MRTIGTLFVVAALAGGCARAQAPAPTTTAGEQIVRVVAREFTFDPREARVKPGRVVFEVRNAGAVAHEYVVAVETHEHQEQNLIQPGDTRRVEYDLRPGTYEVACNVPGHKEAGMTGTVVVAP